MKKRLQISRRLYIAASVLLFAVTMAAQTEEKPDPCEARTYQWIDENGDVHTSPYLETATHPNQMKALVASLYVDRNIPGQKKFFYLFRDEWAENNSDGSTTVYKDVNKWYSVLNGQARTAANQNTNCWVSQDYYLYNTSDNKDAREISPIFEAYKNISPSMSQLKFNKAFNIGADISNGECTYGQRTDITPYDDGKTVLLIEMADDYNATEDRTSDAVWRHTKAITVLPLSRQYRIDNPDEAKRGYMFNINRPLNKFYLALKGDIKIRYMHKRDLRADLAPLYEGYEQVSPNYEPNSEYKFGKWVENAYPEMLDGKSFPVSHNCVSVPYCAHATMMSDKDNTESISANMLVYIPDYRYYGLTLEQIGTYAYTDDYDYRPYYFIPKVTIEASIRSIEMNHDVAVDVDWTSSIKSVTKDNESERYRLLRSYDGVNFTEVPVDEIITVVTEGATMDGATGYFTYADGSTVAVRVKEKQYRQPHKVYYKTFDRYANTEFDEIESNIAEVEIPGYENSTPRLTIALDHESDFDISKQVNKYNNRIDFVLAEEGSDGIKNDNIGEDGKLHLQLNRYTDVRQQGGNDNFTIGSGVKIATGVITKTGEADGIVTYSIELFGKLDKLGPLYTGTLQAAEGEQLHIAGSNNGGDVWAYFNDLFDKSIKDAADGSTYAYRLFATDVRKAEESETPVQGDGDKWYTTQIGSNIVDVTMPRMNHDCGFSDYSLEEIKADKERLRHELPGSVTQVVFMPRSSDPKVVTCQILHVGSRELLATAKRTLQGYWTLKGMYDGSIVPVNVTLNSAAVTADPAMMGEETVMVVSRGANTYGTPRRVMPYLPEVAVKIQGLTYMDDHYENSVDLSVTLDADADNNFVSHGYGVWCKENVVNLNGMQSEIIDPAHNKHSEPLDVDGLTFTYNNGTSATGHEGQSIIDGNADANFVHVRPESERGTKHKPYAMWYLARYYARYIHGGSGEVITSAQAAAADEPRYVIVESYRGSRESGDGVTTGTAVSDIRPDAVYPAVTDDIVNIEGEGPVVVFNLQGMAVATLDDNSGSASGTDCRTISLGHLPAGLYIINFNGAPYKVVKR